MQRLVIIMGLLVFALMLSISFFKAVIAVPGTFAIIFIAGASLISFLALKGDGDWNPESENYPPYKTVLGILLAALLISWVAGTRPTTLDNCPTSVGRWC